MKENRDIEWLVNWAFQTQRVEDAVHKQGPKAPGISQSAMLQMLELGVRVDASSQGEKWDSVRCHDDAVAILTAIKRLPGPAAGLLTIHGRVGTRPDWCPEGVGHEVPVLSRNGKPRRIWRDPARREGDLGLMMQWVGTRPEVVEFHRAQYVVWHAALDAIIIPFNAEAGQFHATGPYAGAMPWQSLVPRIIKIEA